MTYRAWSALKGMTFANGYTLSASYNARQQLEQFEIKNPPPWESQLVMKTWQSYYPDGKVKFVRQDIDGRFHRAFDYDHAGRLKESYSGEDACNFAGQSCANPQPAVYRHTYAYDQWNNMTSRTGNYWGHASNLSAPHDSSNNHNQYWGYDPAGHIIDADGVTYKHDAVGRSVEENSGAGWVKSTYSGDGFVSYREVLEGCGPDCYPYRRTYYVRSTVLGGKAIVELDGETNQNGPYGDKLTGYVYAGDTLLAEHSKVAMQSGEVDQVLWHCQNPVTGSEAKFSGGCCVSGAGTEPDATGVDVGLSDPYIDPSPPAGFDGPKLSGDQGDDIGGRCTLDGISIGCGLASHLLYTGTVIIAPEQKVRGHYDPNTGKYDGFIIWNGQEVNKEGRFEYGYKYKRFNPEIDPETGEPIGETLGYKTVEVEYVGAVAGEFIGGWQKSTPTPTPQNPFPLFGKDNLEIVNDSIRIAQDMTKRTECDTVLQSYGIQSLAALIKQYSANTKNANIFDGRKSTLTGPIGQNGATQSIADYFKEKKNDVGAAVFDNSVTGRGPVTFLGDYFFNPATMANVAQQRGIIILHEAVHQFGGKGDAVFGGSKELSEKIIQGCFPVLKGKLGGVG
jgi:hypothetical protein